jgi:hypothetical protein
MGGYRVTEQAEQLIISTWDSLKKDGKRPSAKQVLLAAEAYLKAHKRKDIFLPKLRKVQNILREATDRHQELSPEQQLQQRPWTMVSLNDYPLPDDAIPHLMQVWRYCRHTDEKFTIRQAKWVSRIYRMLPQMLSLLWSISYIYSKKEELSIMSGIPCDTFMDDVGLVIHDKIEVQTLLETHYNTQSLFDIYSVSLPINHEGLLIEEIAHPIEYYNALLNRTISNKRDNELITMLLDLTSLVNLELESTMFMTYLSWITHIKKTPYWSKLTAEQAINIINKLREWAVKQQSITDIAPKPIKFKVELSKKGDRLSFGDSLTRPEEVLKLLSDYTSKGDSK